MPCKTTFDAGIQQRDNAIRSLDATLASLGVALPVCPTYAAFAPLGAALETVRSAKNAVAIALVDFQQAILCYATAGDGPNANKSAANQSEAIRALDALGAAEGAIQGAIAAVVFVFPTAAVSVTSALAKARDAKGFCVAMKT